MATYKSCATGYHYISLKFHIYVGFICLTESKLALLRISPEKLFHLHKCYGQTRHNYTYHRHKLDKNVKTRA